MRYQGPRVEAWQWDVQATYMYVRMPAIAQADSADSANFLGLQLNEKLSLSRQMAVNVRKTSSRPKTQHYAPSTLAYRNAKFYTTHLMLHHMYVWHDCLAAITACQCHKLTVLDNLCIRLVPNKPLPPQTALTYSRLGLMSILKPTTTCKLRLLVT